METIDLFLGIFAFGRIGQVLMGGIGAYLGIMLFLLTAPQLIRALALMRHIIPERPFLIGAIFSIIGSLAGFYILEYNSMDGGFFAGLGWIIGFRLALNV